MEDKTLTNTDNPCIALQPLVMPPTPQLYCGDCRELAEDKIAPESVDLIFTDPPYPKKFLPLYEWLAKEAARALKPNGFIIAYCGPYWKDKVMEYLNAELQYFWDFALIHNNDTSMMWQRKVISGYKSLLCYHRKGEKPLPTTNVLGKWNGVGGDKRFHKWGQEENSARYYIECFSKENDLVVDYFLGAGTFGVVSKKLNRQFIGFELNPGTYETVSQRIEDESILIKNEQLSLIDDLAV